MSVNVRKPVDTVLAGALLALAMLFAALGVWQVERRTWKHDLIAAVDSRAHAAPIPAPGRADWSTVSAERDAYRRVQVTGRFLPRRETLVRAVSDLGSGYWVITPLDTGPFIVLVNRGFITAGQKQTPRRVPEGQVAVTGLLRISEPGGGFLRRNDPTAGNWYSRDVIAIAHTRGIIGAAPYFIDADAIPDALNGPVGGLTVVRFADNHAQYALTWFAMALLSTFAAWHIMPGGRFSKSALA